MSLPELFAYLAGQPLLALAVAGIFVVTLGGSIRRAAPRAGGFVQSVGNLALLAALLLTIVEVTRLTGGGPDLALQQLDMPRQVVAGGEVRVPVDADGHYWLRGSLNGHPHRFLVDTGATVTAISEATAIAAEVPKLEFPRRIRMRTANGEVTAEMVTLDELRFGNIVARNIDAVVAPGLGSTDVIGMNFLSRLASWRVEGRTLVLTPIAVDGAAQARF